MDVEEIKQKKQELNDKIAGLLNGFEDEIGVHELGREIGKEYVVEVKVEL